MRSSLRLSLATSLLVAAACNSKSGNGSDPDAPAAWLGNVVAITSTDEVVTFFEHSPQSFASRVSITGLAAGEHVQGIDFRTTDNSVVGWTSTGRIVDLDLKTGIATVRGMVDLGSAVGTLSSFAFNPVTGELRAATSAAENVRLASSTGAFVASDTAFAYAIGDVSFGVTPSLVALAHNNVFDKTERNTLFGIDGATNALVQINASDAPEAGNDGELDTLGTLTITPTGPVGFAIGGFDHAFITCSTAGNPVQLYRLAFDGQATPVGPIDPTADVIDVAVRPQPSPVLLGVTPANRLVEFRATFPAEFLSDKDITGMQSGERVVALSVQLGNGEIIALGDTSRLYTLARTGVATPMAASAFAPGLSGTRFGLASQYDIDTPSARVVSDTQQNLSIDFATAATATVESSWVYDVGDPHFGEVPHLVSCAFWGTSPVEQSLWGLDSVTDSFVRMSFSSGSPAPSDGIVMTAFALGLDFDDESELAPAGGEHMLALFRPAGTLSTKVTRVNTVTTQVHILGESTALLDAAVVAPTSGTAIIGLTSTGELVRFFADTSGEILATVSVSGLTVGETLLGIDYRPANNALYGLGDAGRLYVINASTGSAVAVSSTPVTLTGARFCMDFDPRSDELRVLSDTGQNLRIDPDTGSLIAADASLAFELSDPETGTVPNVFALAYENNDSDAMCSAAFAAEQTSGRVVNVGSRDGCTISATSGTLFSVTNPGLIEADAQIGLDIDARGRCVSAYTSSTQPVTLILDLPLSGASSTVTGLCAESLIDIAIVR